MTPHFLPQPALQPIPDTEMYVLVEEYSVWLPCCKRTLRIMAGFVTDGASIPRFLWRVCGHPFSPYAVAPALAHDALYRSRLLPRAECDRELYALMQANGAVARSKAGSFWLAVRSGGWWPWMHHRRRGIQQMRQLVEMI